MSNIKFIYVLKNYLLSTHMCKNVAIIIKVYFFEHVFNSTLICHIYYIFYLLFVVMYIFNPYLLLIKIVSILDTV